MIFLLCGFPSDGSDIGNLVVSFFLCVAMCSIIVSISFGASEQSSSSIDDGEHVHLSCGKLCLRVRFCPVFSRHFYCGACRMGSAVVEPLQLEVCLSSSADEPSDVELDSILSG